MTFLVTETTVLILDAVPCENKNTNEERDFSAKPKVKKIFEIFKIFRESLLSSKCKQEIRRRRLEKAKKKRRPRKTKPSAENPPSKVGVRKL